MNGAVSDEETRRVVAALLSYANRLLNEGKTSDEVERELMAKGLERGPASAIVQRAVSDRARQTFTRDPPEAWAAPARSDDAGSNIAIGAVICVVGILVTVFSYSAAAGGGTYVVAWGAIAFGAIRMFKGFAQSGGGPPAASTAWSDTSLPAATAPSAPPLLLPSSLESVVVLLMTQDQLAARVDTKAVVALGRTVEAEVAGLYWRGEIEEGPLALFVIVKPGRRIKVWAEGIERELSAKDAAVLESRTAAWPAPEVRGIITLAYTYRRKRDPSAGPPQLPRAWRDAAAKSGQTLDLPDGLTAAVWPD